MRIDWIIAAVIFVMFVVWAISYYSLISAGESLSRSGSALQAAGKITEYMEAGFSSVPVNITLPGAMDDVTLWAYMNWTGDGQNSTRVVRSRLSNESLPCGIDGARLYWKANVSAGENHFLIESADLEVTLNCDDTIGATDENQTTMWAAESGTIFSEGRNSQVCGQLNQTYETEKRNIGVTFDFNILIESGGSALTCGRTVPLSGRDVFVYPVSGRLWEGGDVNISVRLW
jgi:hypothetical protein